ncbi:MAG: M23 family metallopeptidase, partial [Desulfuromonadales bacterium]|nr:M23 family metallopeptidase [Desulfuromonadales bacterium]NIS40387.1 M23 family metallopeptidase [Desulfuromonadales bacterium]
MRRYHPITKTWKAHPAIDYAAPTGTPIKAVGDGTIIRIAKDRNNGRHIKIRHNGTYQTLYLHMSRFARGMKKGRKVSQGQVIGYVGSTGLATGPHLCFRMYKHGRPVNPSRVKAKSAKPVSAE